MFPMIMYHLTEGSKTDYGWGWKRVESQPEYDQLVKAGWVIRVSELNKVETGEETDEPETDVPETLTEKVQTTPNEPVAQFKKRGRKPKAA